MLMRMAGSLCGQSLDTIMDNSSSYASWQSQPRSAFWGDDDDGNGNASNPPSQALASQPTDDTKRSDTIMEWNHYHHGAHALANDMGMGMGQSRGMDMDMMVIPSLPLPYEAPAMSGRGGRRNLPPMAAAVKTFETAVITQGVAHHLTYGAPTKPLVPSSLPPTAAPPNRWCRHLDRAILSHILTFVSFEFTFDEYGHTGGNYGHQRYRERPMSSNAIPLLICHTWRNNARLYSAIHLVLRQCDTITKRSYDICHWFKNVRTVTLSWQHREPSAMMMLQHMRHLPLRHFIGHGHVAHTQGLTGVIDNPYVANGWAREIQQHHRGIRHISLMDHHTASPSIITGRYSAAQLQLWLHQQPSSTLIALLVQRHEAAINPHHHDTSDDGHGHDDDSDYDTSICSYNGTPVIRCSMCHRHQLLYVCDASKQSRGHGHGAGHGCTVAQSNICSSCAPVVSCRCLRESFHHLCIPSMMKPCYTCTTNGTRSSAPSSSSSSSSSSSTVQCDQCSTCTHCHHGVCSDHRATCMRCLAPSCRTCITNGVCHTGRPRPTATTTPSYGLSNAYATSSSPSVPLRALAPVFPQ